MTAFKFGDFDYICERAALTICPLLGTELGVMPTCYSRNVQLGSQVIFQPGEEYGLFTSLLCHSYTGRQVTDVMISNMLCSHSRTGHDTHHALPRSIQIYRCRKKGDRPFLLHVHVCRTARHLSRLSHHPDRECRLSGEYRDSSIEADY